MSQTRKRSEELSSNIQEQETDVKANRPISRTYVGLLGALAAVPVLYVAAKSYVYFCRSKALAERSRRFQTDYYVGEIGEAPLLYVALGDSTAVGTGVSELEESYPYAVAQQLAQRGRYVHVVNFAKSGARIADVEQRQLPKMETLRPDIITVSIGANDATHGADPGVYRASYERVLGVLEACRADRCLIALSPDLSVSPAIQPFYAGVVGRRASKQNEMLREITADRPFVLIDLYGEGKLDSNYDPGCCASDMFHPSARGYALWSTLFCAAL